MTDAERLLRDPNYIKQLEQRLQAMKHDKKGIIKKLETDGKDTGLGHMLAVMLDVCNEKRDPKIYISLVKVFGIFLDIDSPAVVSKLVRRVSSETDIINKDVLLFDVSRVKKDPRMQEIISIRLRLLNYILVFSAHKVQDISKLLHRVLFCWTFPHSQIQEAVLRVILRLGLTPSILLRNKNHQPIVNVFLKNMEQYDPQLPKTPILFPLFEALKFVQSCYTNLNGTSRSVFDGSDTGCLKLCFGKLLNRDDLDTNTLFQALESMTALLKAQRNHPSLQVKVDETREHKQFVVTLNQLLKSSYEREETALCEIIEEILEICNALNLVLFRDWKSENGLTMKLKFLNFETNQIVCFQQVNRRKVKANIKILSQEDQAFLKKYANIPKKEEIDEKKQQHEFKLFYGLSKSKLLMRAMMWIHSRNEMNSTNNLEKKKNGHVLFETKNRKYISIPFIELSLSEMAYIRTKSFDRGDTMENSNNFDSLWGCLKGFEKSIPFSAEDFVNAQEGSCVENAHKKCTDFANLLEKEYDTGHWEWKSIITSGNGALITFLASLYTGAATHKLSARKIHKDSILRCIHVALKIAPASVGRMLSSKKHAILHDLAVSISSTSISGRMFESVFRLMSSILTASGDWEGCYLPNVTDFTNKFLTNQIIPKANTHDLMVKLVQLILQVNASFPARCSNGTLAFLNVILDEEFDCGVKDTIAEHILEFVNEKLESSPISVRVAYFYFISQVFSSRSDSIEDYSIFFYTTDVLVLLEVIARQLETIDQESGSELYCEHIELTIMYLRTLASLLGWSEYHKHCKKTDMYMKLLERIALQLGDIFTPCLFACPPSGTLIPLKELSLANCPPNTDNVSNEDVFQLSINMIQSFKQQNTLNMDQ